MILQSSILIFATKWKNKYIWRFLQICFSLLTIENLQNHSIFMFECLISLIYFKFRQFFY
jgi:hypothetical protein